jgi:hypothetical protein
MAPAITVAAPPNRRRREGEGVMSRLVAGRQKRRRAQACMGWGEGEDPDEMIAVTPLL